jgi:2-haloacid dehalogenase
VRYPWLLFDADGTLFDYDGAEGTALERTLDRYGYALRPATRALYRGINAALWQELEAGTVEATTLRVLRFERLFAALGLPVAEGREAGEYYLVQLADEGRLLAGAEAIVRSLASRARMALVTNGLADVQRRRLGDSPIAGLFETITISDELGIAKPDRRIIDHTLRLMGDPPRESVLIIGDSLSSDIQGGINAGIDTCWLAPNGEAPPDTPRPTYTIRNLEEVLALVE